MSKKPEIRLCALVITVLTHGKEDNDCKRWRRSAIIGEDLTVMYTHNDKYNICEHRRCQWLWM